ncbi:hypothetical protein ACSS6W_004391 [Trichoderma asperelloides]
MSAKDREVTSQSMSMESVLQEKTAIVPIGRAGLSKASTGWLGPAKIASQGSRLGSAGQRNPP